MSHLRNFTWQQLLKLACSSTGEATEQAAWEEVAHRLRHLVQVAASREVGVAAPDQDDAVQTLLARLWESERLVHLASLASPGGYLYVALRNELRQRRRRHELERRTARSIPLPTPLHGLTSDVDARVSALRDALASLNPDQRRLLRLRFWENKSIGSIATELDLSYSATAVRLHRLLHHLRALMQENGEALPEP